MNYNPKFLTRVSNKMAASFSGLIPATLSTGGRREEKLNEAKRLLPQLIIKQCDIADIEQRRELYKFCSIK